MLIALAIVPPESNRATGPLANAIMRVRRHLCVGRRWFFTHSGPLDTNAIRGD
jgi:hypothetical protein